MLQYSSIFVCAVLAKCVCVHCIVPHWITFWLSECVCVCVCVGHASEWVNERMLCICSIVLLLRCMPWHSCWSWICFRSYHDHNNIINNFKCFMFTFVMASVLISGAWCCVYSPRCVLLFEQTTISRLICGSSWFIRFFCSLCMRLLFALFLFFRARCLLDASLFASLSFAFYRCS